MKSQAPLDPRPGARYNDCEPHARDVVPYYSTIPEYERDPERTPTSAVLSREARAIKYALDAYESLYTPGVFHRRELESLLNEYVKLTNRYNYDKNLKCP